MKLGQKIKKVREDSDLTLDELSSIFNKKYGFATNKGFDFKCFLSFFIVKECDAH